MAWQPIQSFIGGSYDYPGKFTDSERLINLLPVVNESGTGKEGSQVTYTSAPGLTLLHTFTSPIRGMYYTSIGILAIVAGNKCYSYEEDGTITQRFLLDTSTGKVSMSDDGTGLVVVDGNYGYYYAFATETMTKMTSAGWLGSYDVDFMDGFFLFANNVGATLTPTLFFGEDPLALDALDYNILEDTSDKIVKMFVSKGIIWILKERSSIGYYNTSSGDAANLFQPVGGSHSNVGCLAKDSLCVINDVFIWLGQSNAGLPIVYMGTDNLQGKKISTQALEARLRKLDLDDLRNASAHAYQIDGKPLYCLNVTGLETTWVYDLTVNIWYEFAKWNVESASWSRHIVENTVHSYGKIFASDYSSGKLFYINPDTTYCDSTVNRWERITSATSASMNRVVFKAISIDMETGRGNPDWSETLSDPLTGELTITVSWSDDGGLFYSGERTYGAGTVGNTNVRAIIRNLGSSYNRVWKISGYGPTRVNIVGMHQDVEVCSR